MHRSLITLLPLMFGLMACQWGPHSTPPLTETPPWWTELPDEEGWRFAAGRWSAPSRNKARAFAREQAITELAAQMGVQVKSITKSVETENGCSAVILTEQGITQTVSGFSIVEVCEGVYPDRPHLWETFVLLRVPESLVLG